MTDPDWKQDQAETTRIKPAAPSSPNTATWPSGCHDPDSCHRHSACMYVQCRRHGKDGNEVAAEIARVPIPEAPGDVAEIVRELEDINLLLADARVSSEAIGMRLRNTSIIGQSIIALQSSSAETVEACAKIADGFCTDARKHQMTAGIGSLLSPWAAMELAAKSIAAAIRRPVGQQQDSGADQ